MLNQYLFILLLWENIFSNKWFTTFGNNFLYRYIQWWTKQKVKNKELPFQRACLNLFLLICRICQSLQSILFPLAEKVSNWFHRLKSSLLLSLTPDLLSLNMLGGKERKRKAQVLFSSGVTAYSWLILFRCLILSGGCVSLCGLVSS